ncbi:5-formyltetrahydrofolate cyclo-ligase [archaeon]|nr:MAG: 5-formyltetrahydrofolate cyclo-ligase [archaeon]
MRTVSVNLTVAVVYCCLFVRVFRINSLEMSVKSLLRSRIKRRLKEIASSDIEYQSSAIASHISTIPNFQHVKAVSIYLSMDGEVNTYGLIKDLMETHGKRVYIPKVVGKNSNDMIMLPLSSYSDIESYPRNAWGIPEPVLPASYDENDMGNIDLVLMPGVAFDTWGGRLGHGKGYYDCFIERLCRMREEQNKPRPYLVGLALMEQMQTEELPMEPHDR